MICLCVAILHAECKQFRVSIEFSLEHPEGGIQFVIPKGEGTMAQVCVLGSVFRLSGHLSFIRADQPDWSVRK